MALKAIGTIGSIETITQGGYVFTRPDSVIYLMCFAGTGTFSTYRKPFVGFGYLPSGANNFRIRVLVGGNGGASERYALGYSTGDAGLAGGVPTGMVFAFSNNASSTNVHSAYAGQLTQEPVNILIPNGKYTTARHDFNGCTLCYGYEEA